MTAQVLFTFIDLSGFGNVKMYILVFGSTDSNAKMTAKITKCTKNKTNAIYSHNNLNK